MRVIVDIDTNRWDVKDEVLHRAVNAFPQQAIDGASMIMLDVLQKNTPVRTGNLKRSETRTVLDKRATVQTNTGYGGFVNDGIGPSPGRFVPAIGKRIRTGMHPGFHGRHFKERTIDEANPIIKDFLQNMLDSELP